MSVTVGARATSVHREPSASTHEATTNVCVITVKTAELVRLFYPYGPITPAIYSTIAVGWMIVLPFLVFTSASSCTILAAYNVLK